MSDDDDSSDFSAGSLDDDDDEYYTTEGPADVPTWQNVPPLMYSQTAFSKQSSSTASAALADLEIYRDLKIIGDTAADCKDPWIRLLQIQPSTGFDQSLHCKLLKRQLWDAGPYIALSYSWGDGSSSSAVFIETQDRRVMRMPVSEHLRDGLRRLRGLHDAVNVWVDAICINQKDVLERSEQVHIMAQIYSQASEVRIWLGEYPEHERRHATDFELFSTLCRQPYPWWTRLWIVQECAYAEACPVVMLGRDSLSLEQFVNRWRAVAYSEHSEKRAKLEKHLDLLCMPFEAWRAQQHDNQLRLPLLHRLEETANRECGDPRDRVYALLSLVEEREARQLQPDYRKSFSEVVFDVAELVGCFLDVDDGSRRVVGSLCRGTEHLQLASVFLRAERNPQRCVHALRGAMDSKKYKTVHLIVRQCAYWTAEERSALVKAASEVNQPALVRLLLAPSGPSEIEDVDGSNAVHDALLIDHSKAPLLHTESMAKTDITEALFTASRRGWTEVVKESLGHRPRSSVDYTDALQAAAHAGHLAVVQLLLDEGADVNCSRQGHDHEYEHMYALQAASAKGRLAVVELLLEKGASLNVQGGRYDTALQAASAFGHLDVAAVLIESGADVNAQGGDYGNALQAAAAQGSVELVQLLLKNGAFIDAKRGQYGSALQAALALGHTQLVDLLLEAGADITVQGGWYEGALQAACKGGCVAYVDLLLERGAPINAQGGYYGNALHCALATGHTDIAKLLLENGADVNAPRGMYERIHDGARTSRDWLAEYGIALPSAGMGESCG